MKLRLLAIMAMLLMITACSTSEPQSAPADGDDAAATTTKTAPDLPVGLEVGNLAPEIEGKDLDDVTFKLSDYRGKVILLDFWGDW